MNAYQARKRPTYGYDSAQPQFKGAGAPIFGYDANWFTAFNLDPPGGNTSNFRQFTGKERDSESGLDYFGARYYGSALGRFSSADEPLIDREPSDPQSWNLYGYVRNNPVKNVDRFGLDCITTSNQSSSGISVTTDRGGSADSCSGTYINGTVDTSSYSYNGSSLSFSDNTAGGGGALNLVSPSTPNDALSPDVANMLNRAGNMAAPGVNLAAGGLMIFGSVVAPLPMALAQYGAGNGSKFDLAMALLPGGLGLLATEEKAIAGVLKQIASGTTKSKVFENFAGSLPAKVAGYYREYTVPLAGQSGPGASRLVTGASGEVYYTADHYTTFTRIK